MSELPLNPLFDRVLLQRPRQTKIGSIHIPEQFAKRNAPTRGMCVATGAACDETIEIGKSYVFGVHAGTWINADGMAVPNDDDGEFFVCVDTDLIAEVNENG